MVARNPNFAKLEQNYVFAQVEKARQALLEKNPDANIINLGVGNTTQALPLVVTHAMSDRAEALGTDEGYTGYGPMLGEQDLRELIAHMVYEGRVNADEVYISDGSKCDVGRFQHLFGSSCSLAVQDPSYPAYVASQTLGSGGEITYLPCTPENKFFPDLSLIKEGQVIAFCSPNNPTGMAATEDQLTELIKVAKEKNCFILFDSAYSSFVRKFNIPKSIFEVEGARDVAIEVGSFSKFAGFTGVRLGWTVIPKELKFSDGSPVHKDWEEVLCTFFNGASNVAQSGGLAVLSPKGHSACRHIEDIYMNNARRLSNVFIKLKPKVYGGEHSPYLWVQMDDRKSWDVFEELLNECQVICMPGSGFGPAGEGFVRFSCFATPEEIDEACERLQKHWS